MIVELAFGVAAAVLLAYVLVCAVRLGIGPTAADRAVALGHHQHVGGGPYGPPRSGV